MDKIIYADFVTIDPDRKIIMPFIGKENLRSYYYQNIFTLVDVKITICSNGVLEVNAKQAVYMNDFYDNDYIFASEPELEYKEDVEINLKGPFKWTKFKPSELDIKKTKIIHVTRSQWFWNWGKYKTAQNIECYDGLQVKFVDQPMTFTYHGWELREF